MLEAYLQYIGSFRIDIPELKMYAQNHGHVKQWYVGLTYISTDLPQIENKLPVSIYNGTAFNKC